VEAAARRQKWIDQAQSLNIYMAGASGKKLDETYKLAWLRGLKTTYYLRTTSATLCREVDGGTGQDERRAHARGAAACLHGRSRLATAAIDTTRPATSSSARSTTPIAKPASEHALIDAMR
jgi:ribonucleoside-diphosphate reductase alpha chain